MTKEKCFSAKENKALKKQQKAAFASKAINETSWSLNFKTRTVVRDQGRVWVGVQLNHLYLPESRESHASPKSFQNKEGTELP